MTEETQSNHSWTDSPQLREALLKHHKAKGRMETWTAMLGIKGLEARQKQLQEYNAAANRAVRRKMFGENPPENQESDVGTTILGDVTHPTPVVISGQQQSGSLGPLLAAALGMLGPLGGVAGYFLNQAMQARQPAAAATVNESRDAPASPFSSTINTREELGVRILSEDELLP